MKKKRVNLNGWIMWYDKKTKWVIKCFNKYIYIYIYIYIVRIKQLKISLNMLNHAYASNHRKLPIKCLSFITLYVY